MAARKCLNCNYRILQPEKDPRCPNCGKPHSRPAASTSMPLPPPAGYAPSPPPTGYAPVPSPAPPLPMPIVPAPAAPVPMPAPVAPSPAPAASPSTPGKPARASDLEGTIASQPDTREELLRTHWAQTTLGCIFYPLLFVLSPILFLFSVLGMNSRPDRRMSVTTARVRKADGTLHDVRFEGDLVRSRIALGDRVSLRGSERNGVLIVKQGYNHTTGGEIRVRPPQLPWLSIIVLVILIAIVLMACLLCNSSSYYHG